MEIAFWILIIAIGAGALFVCITLYNEIFHPYGKYKTFAEYYNATYAEMHRKDKK